MIAQLKVTSNLKEIEAVQKEIQKIALDNQKIEADNAQLSKAKRVPTIPLPKVPEQTFGNNDLLLDSKHITLAFVNANGEISIKYQGDNFNLVYSDLLWNEIKKLPQFTN